MRYLCIFKGVEGTPPSQDEISKMGALIEEMAKKGVLLATEGCLPTATGFKIRRSGEKYTITDGPFTESKEVIGGFALINVQSKDEAIAWTKRFLQVAGDGESEIRKLYEQSPMPQ
jgi:hypothetical protein